MIITDEMVAIAHDVANNLPERDRDDFCTMNMMRAALEAVAPMIIEAHERQQGLCKKDPGMEPVLIAQGMREALAIARKFNDGEPDSVDCIETAILARAQELDQQ